MVSRLCLHPTNHSRQLTTFFMQFENSEAESVKPRTALVQGESFRCVGVEVRPGHWRRIQDGAVLPPVLDVVSVIVGTASLHPAEIYPATVSKNVASRRWA